MLTKSELQSQLREELEALTRQRMDVEESKAAANKAHNETIKEIDAKIRGVLNELETGQGNLPLETAE